MPEATVAASYSYWVILRMKCLDGCPPRLLFVLICWEQTLTQDTRATRGSFYLRLPPWQRRCLPSGYPLPSEGPGTEF